MITGFNTDVKHKSKVYHIQTEDKGRANPKIESLVYVGGEILDSFQTSYEKDKASLTEEDIMDLMEGQHKRVIRSIKIGKYDGEEPFPADVVSGRDLDELIAEYLDTDPAMDQIKLVVNGVSMLRGNQTSQLKIETKKALGGEPLKDSEIRIKLLLPEQQPTVLAQGRTDETGFFITDVSMPDYPEAETAVMISALSELGTAEQKIMLRH